MNSGKRLAPSPTLVSLKNASKRAFRFCAAPSTSLPLWTSITDTTGEVAVLKPAMSWQTLRLAKRDHVADRVDQLEVVALTVGEHLTALVVTFSPSGPSGAAHTDVTYA